MTCTCPDTVEHVGPYFTFWLGGRFHLWACPIIDDRFRSALIDADSCSTEELEAASTRLQTLIESGT